MKRLALFRFIPFKFAALLAPLIAAWPVQQLQAAALTWNGGDTTGNWSAPLNWSGSVPAAGDTLTFSGTTNIITSNDIAGLAPHRILIDTGAANFILGGNALTLNGSAGANPLLANNSLNSTSTVSLATMIFDGSAGTGLGQIQANSGNFVIGSAINVAGGTMLDLSTGAGRTAIYNGTITGGAGGVNIGGSGLTGLNAANSFVAGQTVTVSGGRLNMLNAGGLGTLAAAANANVVVASGATVNFNGINMSSNGKNFTIAGTGTDGRGALVNHYNAVDAMKAVANLTLSGNATIGGTNTIDIGTGTGQTLDGGGFTLTVANSARFNIRAAVSNLPSIILNKGNVEVEGVDVGAGTSVTVNGIKSTMGAHTGAGTRTWAGDITLNNGGNIGGIGGTATNGLIVGSAGRTLTINGEGRLNANTAGYMDWTGISGVSNLRVDSTVAGSGRMVINQFGTAANGNQVTLTQDNPGFSGNVFIAGGATSSTLNLGTGGTTGDLGTTSRIEFGATSATVPSVLNINRSNAITLNASLAGAGSLLINGGATVTLNGANTTGISGTASATTNVNNGTLILGAANALSPRSNLQVGGGGVSTGSTTKLNGFSPTVERLDDSTTTNLATPNRIVNGSPTAATLTFNQTNAAPVFGDFNGVIGGPGADENNLGITKLGASDWTLTGSAHTYTGLTTISGGRFRLGLNATFGNAVLGATGSAASGTVVNPGGSLDFQGVTGFTNGVGNEFLTISGRGNGWTANAFENGALVNNGTANTVGANNVTLAGNASIGKNGAGVVAGTDWDVRNTGLTSVFNLAGFTLRKVGNNTVNLADVTGGTGNGNIDVLHGTLGIERGTRVNGTGTVTVKSGATLNLNDNGSAVSVTKSLALNAGTLANQNGSHSFTAISSNGFMGVANNSAADTLGLGDVTTATRGNGAFVINTGSVTLGNVNGVTNARPGPGWIVGSASGTAVLAERSGANLVPIATTTNTGTGNFALLANQDVLANSAVDADRTISGPATELTLRTLATRTDVKVNDGALLRIGEGSITMGNAGHWLQTSAGSAMGRLTSGRADGELHLNLPTLLDTGLDTQVRLQVTDNPITSGAKTGTFVPNLLVKNGAAGLPNFGNSAFAAPTANTQNNFTAGTIINGGRVVPAFGNAFGTGTLTVRDGGQLALFGLSAANGAHISNTLNLAGAGAFENGGFLGAVRFGNGTATTPSTLSGTTVLNGEVRLHGNGAADTGLFAGVVKGTGGIDKTGAGTLLLTNANTYTGSTTITNGALQAYQLGNGSAASSIGASSNAGSNLVLNGGTLRYLGTGAASDRNFTVDLQGGAIDSAYHTGALVINGSATLTEGGDRTLTLTGLNRNTNVFAGSIGNSNAGRTALTKTGLGTWQLTGNNTFTGTLTLSGATNTGSGQLIVGDGATNGTIGNGILVSMADGADITSLRSDNVTWTQRFTGAITATTTTLPSALTEIIQRGSGTLTLGGYEDNSAASVRVESGTLVLAKDSNEAVHASFGSTVVNGGTLRLAGTGNDQIHNGATNNNSTLYVNAGTFDMNGRYEAVQRLEGSGGKVTNSAAGTTSELVLGTANGSSFFFRGGNAGYGGLIEDGSGTMKVQKQGNGLALIRGDNTYSGGTEILQGQLQVGKQGTTGSIGTGPVYLGAGDNASIGTLIVDRQGTLTMNQVISGPGNVTMQGNGELKLTAANAWEGLTTVRRGTLTADLRAQNNTLPVNANYNLEGGTLKIVGSGGTSVQQFTPAGVVGGTALFGIAGGNIQGDNNGGSLTVSLPNSFTRNSGGSVDFQTAGSGTTTFRTGVANANTILGSATAAYATYNGSTWAVQTGGEVTGLAAGGYNTLAGHLDVAGAVPIAAPTTAATVRVNAPVATTIDVNAAVTLAQGGFLVTPAVGANPVSIISSGGTGSIATGGNEILVHQHNTAGDLTIGLPITGTSALTKAGNGKLILSGANTSTGNLAINQGSVQIGSGTSGAWSSTGTITNDGTLILGRTDGTFAAPMTQTNVISGSGNLAVQAGTGWVNMNKTANTFTGEVTLSSGYLHNYNNTSGQLAPVVLGDANTGANPVGLVYNAATHTLNYPIVVSASGTGPAIIGTSGGTGNVIFNGNIELNRPTTLTSYTSDRTTFLGVISGNVGTLSIDVGGGTGILPGATLPGTGGNNRRVTLEQDNTFVGNVEVRNSSVLQIGAGINGLVRDQIPDASNVSLIGAGAALRLNFEGETINNLNGDIGSTVDAIVAGGNLTVLSVNGGIFDGTLSGGSMYLEKNGAGTLSLGGTADNPGGKVRMNSGTLNLNKTSAAAVHAVAVELTQTGGSTVITGDTIGANSDQIYDGSVYTLNGGTFDLNGRNETIAVVQGLGGTITNSSAGTTSTLSIGSALNAATILSSVYYGSINDGAGVLKLVKNNSVAHGLVLGGDNTYSGGTTLDAGVLQLGTGGTTGNAGTGPISSAANTRIVVDRSNAFTMVNSISGGASLTLQGGGTTSLTGTNTNTGLVTINDGTTLSVGSGGASGSLGSGNISNFGELRFNRTGTLIVTQSIADLELDSGIVRQAGPGKTILSGNSMYYGDTIIDAGTLQVDGNLFTTDTYVNATGTLGGDGAVADVFVNGGTVAPGASPGSLGTGSVVTTSTGTYAFEINGLTGGTQHDQINTTGSITLGSAVSALTVATGFTPAIGDVVLIWTNDAADAVSGTFTGLPEGAVIYVGETAIPDDRWIISYVESSLAGSDGNDISLRYVPEPSSALLAAGAGLLAFGRRRRRA